MASNPTLLDLLEQSQKTPVEKPVKLAPSLSYSSVPRGGEPGFETHLTSNQRLCWLALSRSRGVGPITFFDLLNHYGTIDAAYDALPYHAARGGRTKIDPMSLTDAAAEMARCDRLGIHVVLRNDPHYPPLLRQISDPPPVLNVRGNLSFLTSRRHVAVVGARNASVSGFRLAEKLSRDIGAGGYGVVSGLARGIDTAAHQGALVTGTVAVMAADAFYVYPPENKELYEKILENGAIITEMPLGTTMNAALFPRRNRIVSGMSSATLVVEATARSGSLITARMAAEQNRDVMACPGSILEPRSMGPNTLIRQGATLIRSAADVIELMDSLRDRLPFPSPFDRDQALREGDDTGDLSDGDMAALRGKIMAGLTVTPVLVDDVIRAYAYPTAAIRLALVELELAGRIGRFSGGKIALCPEWD